MKDVPISQLTNIGPTIARNLQSVGVHTKADIQKLGPVHIYLKLQSQYPKKTWPVCYYLYSLEGALTDTYWDDIPEKKKQSLLMQIGKKK